MTQPTLLQRVKTYDRVPTDIADSEVQRVIDEANAEVVARWGPHANTASPITVTVPGGTPTIDLTRPLDETEDFTVTEYWRDSWGGSATPTVLGVNDYRVLFGGRTLERLYTGDNPAYSWVSRSVESYAFGGSTGWVTVEYVPVNDGNQREEVILRLVLLSLEYDGKIRSDIGDTRQFPVDYTTEREKLLKSLSPRKGLLLR